MNAAVARDTQTLLDNISEHINTMHKLSNKIEVKNAHDRTLEQNITDRTRVEEDLETEFMDRLLDIALHGTSSFKKDFNHYTLPEQIREAKLYRQGLIAKCHTNRQERRAMCDKFRKELIIMSKDSCEVMTALQKQPSQEKKKKSMWGMRNPYAVEELDQ